MSVRTFTIYRSSAGSGKTRTLAKEYIRLALQFRAEYFRHILAVTFTNKATQEMKDRILAYLDKFSRGEENELAAELRAELNLDENSFREQCRGVQREILHHYNQFSISTIDAFFQRVIRSFTRESGLTGDYQLEVDQDLVLKEVIGNLIDELGKDKELTSWIVDFARENLESDKAWDVRFSLIEFAKEIFKEEFKLLEDDLVKNTEKKNFFRDLQPQLRKRKYEFIGFVKKKASEALDLIHAQNLSVDDIKWGGSGPYNLFRKISQFTSVGKFTEKEVGSRPNGDYQSPKNWPGKNLAKQQLIIKLAEEKLIPLMNEILEYRKRNYRSCLSAEVVLNNFYAFGLIADISRKLKEYKEENGMMLLADAPKFLNGVIRDSDTPFIYEKVGSFYKHYLIDEFQDTSVLQWQNFFPLVADSLDQGNQSLVVGDVKQAIYRWRGGNLKLLQQQIEPQIGQERVNKKVLNSNFRSAANLVQFNNLLFQTASSMVAEETGAAISTEAYADVVQKNSDPSSGNKSDGGFVQIQFIKEGEEKKWREMATESVPVQLEKLQQAGVPLKDIAILVRTNGEGQQIVAHLLQYKKSGKAKQGLCYDVISNESLRIDGAASVNLVLAGLKYIFNPDDAIARAELAFEFDRIHPQKGGLPSRPLAEVLAVTNQSVFESYLPDSFTRQKSALKKLPLFELTETLIQVFGLTKQHGELTYLQSFQDLVLNFYTRERNDLQAFLEWWEENKHTEKTSIKSSGEIDAAEIMTIHKAKGLQFKYVIVPFCAWGLDSWESNTLWVQSDQELFKDAGFLPVKYVSALKDTHFSEYYTEERASSYLDNLNLLYVALTRAESGLLVTAPHPKIKNQKPNVGGLLYDSIQSNLTLKEDWNEAEQKWEIGQLKSGKDPDKKEEWPVIPLRSYPTSRWRDKLVIRQAGKNFFEKRDESREKQSYGIHIHTILSFIKHSSEIDSALDVMIRSGLMTKDERQPVRDQLTQLLAHKQVADWFTHDWTVRTEVPILVPGEGESRVDRLMTKGKKAVVVDFKTGVPVKSDQKQVLQYVEILRKMDFTEVEGYVLYLREGEVVEVKTGKAKMVKKKDENQLDLEL